MGRRSSGDPSAHIGHPGPVAMQNSVNRYPGQFLQNKKCLSRESNRSPQAALGRLVPGALPLGHQVFGKECAFCIYEPVGQM